jgi:ribosome-associated protein
VSEEKELFMAVEHQVLETIVKALDSKRAEDIQVIGIGDLTILGDYFVIANGTSTTHTRTLADEVEYKLSEMGLEPLHREGRGNGSNWIVLDYGDVIVHVFYKETRDFYQLERMWADGVQVDISDWTKKNEA